MKVKHQEVTFTINAPMLCGSYEASNSQSLYQETGVDVRRQCRLSYIISEGREGIPRERDIYKYKYTNVYAFEEGILESYDYPRKLARETANTIGKKVFVTVKSSGGGLLGWEEPDEVREEVI